MSVLFIILPLALLVAACALAAFIWAVRGGQMDDLDTPAVRILFDDDDRAKKSPKSGEKPPDQSEHAREERR